MSSTLRATGDSVNRTLGAHIDNMPQELEKGVERAEHVIQDEPGEAEHYEEEEEEEEEGWTSDRSDNEPSAASPNRRGRSNSPKSRTSPKAVGAPPRRGRRRSSLRKGTPGRTHLPLKLQPHPEISSLSEGADGQDGGGHRERGRSEVVVSEVNSDEPPFRKNRWLDTIRHMDARREASPARSIRFADEIGDEENRSGAATPQLSILQDSGPPPLPLTSGDVDSPQSKVTFEVGNN